MSATHKDFRRQALRKAREWAVQMIFQLDANPEHNRPLDTVFEEFWTGAIRLQEGQDFTMAASSTPDLSKEAPKPEENARVFCEKLVRGILAHKAEIDEKLSSRMKNWKLSRIGAIERAVLRLGAYELLFETSDFSRQLENRDAAGAPQKAPPRNAVINEAVDLAKYFGSSESGRFVNGILDGLAGKEHGKRERGSTWVPETKQDERAFTKPASK